MKIKQIKEILQAEVLSGEEFLDSEVLAAFGADLMSDVMTFVNDKVVLLTGLVNPQVVRTAEMLDIKAIVFVRGKKPGANIIELARDKEMVILSTKNSLYVSSGLLFSAGLKGVETGEKNEYR